MTSSPPQGRFKTVHNRQNSPFRSNAPDKGMRIAAERDFAPVTIPHNLRAF